MSMTDYVWMALRKGKRLQTEMVKEWGFSSVQAMNNKFSRGSWSAEDLAHVAQFTGGVLKIAYPDGQEILILPEEKKQAAKD